MSKRRFGEDGSGGVVARRRIEQNPLALPPVVPVPTGRYGHIEDMGCDDDIYVDFGEPYGVVLCSSEDLR